MRQRIWGVLLALGLTAASACGGSTNESDNSTGGAGSGGSGGADASAGAGGALPDGSAGSGGLIDAGALGVAGCTATPPPGAKLAPDPPKYSNGTCPTLPTTTGTVDIQTGSATRQFILAVPANLKPNEHLPVIFLWHWLGGDANGFYTKGEVQDAVDQQRFLAVIPESSGSLFKWPYTVGDTDQAVQAELTFFDDMLSCVSAQFNVNKECVGSAGVSAGALWTDQLVGYRSQYLSSFLSLSGGVGLPSNSQIRPWKEPVHPIPGIVLWGGPQDICVFQHFQDLSHNLEDALVKDGSFFAECVHNCAHAEPPFDPPDGYSTYAGLWQFVLDHPYWLPKGYSPYYKTGLPIADPSWCGLGKGSATPRTGTCPPPSCPF